MAISLSSPLTGAAQTGLTAPTYTLTVDQAPSLYGKQWTVSAIGGTQTGVNTHSVSLPFTISFFRPAKLRSPGTANSQGVVNTFPVNTYKVITRKGAAASSNSVNPPQLVLVRTEISVAAGIDSVSPAELRAALSLHFGACNQVSAELGNTAVTGIL